MLRLCITIILLASLASSPLSAQQAPASENELRAGRLLVRGLSMLQIGDPVSARENLEVALRLAPDNAAILAAISDVYAYDRNMAEAIRFARQAFDASPTDPDIAGRLSDYLARDGNTTDGVRVLERHSTAAGRLDSHLMLIRFLEAHGRSDDAVRQGRSGFERFGADGSLFSAILDLKSEGESADDREALLIQMALESGNPFFAAALIMDSEATDDAASRMELELAEAYPTVSGLRELSTPPAKVADDPHREAAEAVSRDAMALYRAATANPRDDKSWSDAATALLGEGRAGLAHEVARDAASFFPGRDELSALRLRAAIGIGDKAAILEAARAALRFDAAVYLAYAAAGWALADEQDDLFEEAIEYITSIQPSDAIERHVAALALAGLQDYPREVNRLINRTEESARASAELAGLRGLIEAARGNADMAREWLDFAVQSGAASPLVLDTFADILSASGDSRRADELRTLANDRRSSEP
jgi:hypothetical protein